VPSEYIVDCEIEGESILVPIVVGIADVDDAISTISETGRAFWKRLDGLRTMRQVTAKLASKCQTPAAQMKRM
jgi:hypothetical protein